MEGSLEKECLREVEVRQEGSRSHYQPVWRTKPNSPTSRLSRSLSALTLAQPNSVTQPVSPPSSVWQDLEGSPICLGSLTGTSQSLRMGILSEETSGLDPGLPLRLPVGGPCSPTEEFSNAGGAPWVAMRLCIGWVLLSLGLSPWAVVPGTSPSLESRLFMVYFWHQIIAAQVSSICHCFYCQQLPITGAHLKCHWSWYYSVIIWQ